MNISTAGGRKVTISGIPTDAPKSEAALLRSRIDTWVGEFLDRCGRDFLEFTVVAGERRAEPPTPSVGGSKTSSEEELAKRAERFQARPPVWHMESLVLPAETRDQLRIALRAQELQTKLYQEWGLAAIEPFPRTVLNFHGAPGTGKTMAAHAVADHLGKPILTASYADIESMYHGEAPKNVDALFHAAETQNALLFIDEADSLLSRRLVNVTQGAEQSANSLRSQLLICLERFRGIVVFATNLVQNYDPAFESRMQQVAFSLPDGQLRRQLWQSHLPLQLPLAGDVDLEELAEKTDGLSGREMKNAVIAAAMRAADENALALQQRHFLDALATAKRSRTRLVEKKVGGEELPGVEKQELSQRIRTKLRAEEE